MGPLPSAYSTAMLANRYLQTSNDDPKRTVLPTRLQALTGASCISDARPFSACHHFAFALRAYPERRGTSRPSKDCVRCSNRASFLFSNIYIKMERQGCCSHCSNSASIVGLAAPTSRTWMPLPTANALPSRHTETFYPQGSYDLIALARVLTYQSGECTFLMPGIIIIHLFHFRKTRHRAYLSDPFQY